MPALLGAWVRSSMDLKVLVCTAKQGTGGQLQGSCKSRGNPEVQHFKILLKNCDCIPKFPQLLRFVPHFLRCCHSSVPFPFVFPENPTAISYITCFPFKLSFLCASSPLLHQFWSHLCTFLQHSETSQSQSTKESPEKKGYPGLCIFRLKPTF